MSTRPVVIAWIAFCCTASLVAGETRCWLDDIDLAHMTSGGERPRPRTAVGGNPLKIARHRFSRGVGVQAESWFSLQIHGGAIAFEAQVGVDDEELIRGRGSVRFRVYAGNRCVADSDVIRAREPARRLHADLTGAQVVTLHVSDAGDGDAHDHADWCDAVFTLKPGARLAPLVCPPTRQEGILTPPPPRTPRINGARRFGARPDNPVLFTIPASGERPMTFSARGLPDGLTLNPQTGLIRGTVTPPGVYEVTLEAANAHGRDGAPWQVVVGETLALTPPMGWNSWNRFAHTVSDAKIRAVADAMVESGLIQHGWSYINIDDTWQREPSGPNDPKARAPVRDAQGRILPNARFPDMSALTRYVHDRGLKIGIYTSPGPLTCAGYAGSWQHEAQDAAAFAAWGFDYLKYDWCSYARIAHDNALQAWMKPYLLMGGLLRRQPRDIVFSICQYGEAHVSAWGAVAGGNCWRTTPDVIDTWQSVRKTADAQDGLEHFAGPGRWNDPDMLVVGTVGWGTPHPSRLTANEQYAHLSLWCLLSAPLLIGCDLTDLDPFTRNLLTNDEVLAVNQDALGKQARRVMRSDTQEIWVKPLANQTLAVGLFNRGMLTAPVRLRFSDLGLQGPQRLRDLWRQQDLPRATEHFTTELPGHGVALLRISPLH